MPEVLRPCVRMLLVLTLPVLFFACQREAAPPPAAAPEPAGPEALDTGQLAPGTNVDLSLIDPTVAPGDDFFRHANGAWLTSYELPPDKTGYGTFYELNEKNQERVQGLI